MYPVRVMCRVLEVSSSGYYAWRKRAPSERSKANAVLLKKIEQFHKRQLSHQTQAWPPDRSSPQSP